MLPTCPRVSGKNARGHGQPMDSARVADHSVADQPEVQKGNPRVPPVRFSGRVGEIDGVDERKGRPPAELANPHLSLPWSLLQDSVGPCRFTARCIIRTRRHVDQRNDSWAAYTVSHEGPGYLQTFRLICVVPFICLIRQDFLRS